MLLMPARHLVLSLVLLMAGHSPQDKVEGEGQHQSAKKTCQFFF
jgi:hypothetical protein